MLTVSPLLKDFPRHNLHGFVERYGVGFQGGMDRLREGEVKLPSQLFSNQFRHLGDGVAIGTAQTMQCVKLQCGLAAWRCATCCLEIPDRGRRHSYLLGNISQRQSSSL